MVSGEQDKKSTQFNTLQGLLPDDVMCRLLTSELERVQHNHWILDGFPRTLGQGELLDGQLKEDTINLVVNLDVPDSVILERIQGE